MTPAVLDSAPADSNQLSGEADDTFLTPGNRTIIPAGLVGWFDSTAESEDRGGGTAVRHMETKPEVLPIARNENPLAEKKLQVVQQFEGVVLESDGTAFWAELRDLTNAASALETAEFSTFDVSPADRGLLRPGCVFYWILGVEQHRGGQLVNISMIRVRRTPKWTKKALDAIDKDADALLKLFQDEQSLTAGSR